MNYLSPRKSLLIVIVAALIGAAFASYLFAGELEGEEIKAPDEARDAAVEPSLEQQSPELVAKRLPQKPPERPSQEDVGIFSEFDDQVRLEFPSWLESRDVTVVRTAKDASAVAYVDGAPVGLAHDQMGSIRTLGLAGNDDGLKNDRDEDAIPDGLDILIGAKKAAINNAKYQGGYIGMEYPGGDVERTEGVCTDVVVRAVRNAGIDLQKELHEDIKARPRAFPMVKKPDPNIDQRRVRTLLPYFKGNWQALDTEVPSDDHNGDTWAPGDILFMNTMGDGRPEHVGIVSDRVGESGLPLVINNWTHGYHTSAMDLLDFVPVTHRFRVPSEPIDFETLPNRLDVVLDAYGIELPTEHKQVVLVVADEASSSQAELRRFEQKGGEKSRWEPVGKPTLARLGSAGLGRGRGLVEVDLDLEPKAEGDRRAPAGVFALGEAFGSVDKPYEGDWPWRKVDANDRWVDDPNSDVYNTLQRTDEDEPSGWKSAEDLSQYRAALVVRHNMDPVEPSAGSAIFVHSWTLRKPTLGCTGLEDPQMLELLAWLDPEAKPVLVQLPAP